MLSQSRRHRRQRQITQAILATGVSGTLASSAWAAAPAFSVGYGGGTYTQNFDTTPYNSGGADVAPVATPVINGTTYTLPASGAFDLTSTLPGGSALTGWYGSTPLKDVYGANGGSTTTGGIYSFGATGSSDRALGIISTSTTGVGEVGLLLYNASATTYTQFTLSYGAELWHQGTTAKTLNFGYAVQSAASATSLPTTGLTAVSALGSGNFTVGTAVQATDGTAPVAVNNVSDTNQALSTSWAPGSYLWLTWTMNSAAGSGQGIGIDDLSFLAGIAGGPGKTDVWNTGSTWDTTSANWLSGGVATTYADSDVVQFNNTNVGTVNIAAGGVTPYSVTVANTTGTYTFTGGPIMGSASLTMNGTGTLVLASTNTYTGGTDLNAGTVSVASDSALGSASGPLAFNGGTLRTTAGITSSRAITLSGAGTIDTDNVSSTLSGAFTGTGSFNVVGGGTVVLTTSVPAGNLAVRGSTLVLQQSSSTTNNLVTDSTGSAFTGNLIIANGSRTNFNAGSFAGGGQIQVQSTGASLTNLSGSGSVATIGNAIMLNSNNAAFTRGDVTATTYVPGSFSTTIGATTGGGLVVSAPVSGNSDLDISNSSSAGGGAGSITFAAANTYTGTTTITAGSGTIIMGTANVFPKSTDVIEGTNNGLSSPILDLNGDSQEIASLSDGANVTSKHFLTITNNGSSATMLNISGSTVPASGFAGIISDGNSATSLIRSGTGQLKLTNADTYSGTTTVSGGTLILSKNGSLPNSAITVNGGNFGGAGTLGKSLTVNSGTLFEGNGAIGSLTTSSGVSLSSGSILRVQVEAPTGGTPVEGTDNDTVVLNGSGGVFSIGGSTLSLITVGDFSNATLPITYRIVDATGGSGNIVDSTRSFANLTNGQFSQNGVSYSVSYTGGDAIDLTLNSVPEPSCAAALLAGGFLLRRRRAKRAT